jgi:hypothetical protein
MELNKFMKIGRNDTAKTKKGAVRLSGTAPLSQNTL